MKKLSGILLRVVLCCVLLLLAGSSGFSPASAQAPEPPPPAVDEGVPPPAPPAGELESTAPTPVASEGTPASLLPSTEGGTLIPFQPQADGLVEQAENVPEIIVPFLAAPCTQPLGEWETKTPLSNGVYGMGIAGDGVYVYAAGGYFSSGAKNQFSRYDPRTDSWTVLAPLPTGVDSSLTVYAEGKIYVIGGITESSQVTDLVQIYSISAGTWSTGTVMPGVRSHLGGGYYLGKIYAVGGYSTTAVSSQNQTWEYSIAANSWTAKATLPTALGGPGSGVVNGQLYIIGGRDSTTDNLTSVYAYSISGNSWSTKTSLPVGVNYPGAAVYQNRIWVFGGGAPFTGLTNTQIYDPVGNSWSSGPPLNVGRSFQGGAAVRNQIVSVGGWSSTYSNAVEVATQAPLNVLIIYSDVNTPPTNLQFDLMAQPGVGQVDVFDGQSATPTLTQLQAYDVVVPFSNTTWANAAALGDALADYQDGGGVVVALVFSSYSTIAIAGRWNTGGYSPFNVTSTSVFSDVTLGTIHRTGHPLMAGVTSLAVYHHLNLTLASAAVPVASWSDGTLALAYKGRAVGVNAYLGNYNAIWSGDFAAIIANAGYMLRAGSPSCVSLACKGPSVIQGAISVTDSLQTGRLYRYDPGSTCLAPKSCPGVSDSNSRHYDIYPFVNNTSGSQCITVTLNAGTCVGTTFIQSAAYLGSFNPANLCTNYLADIAGSPNPTGSYSFSVSAWQTYNIVVNEVEPSTFCSGYTLTVTPQTCPIKEVLLPLIRR